MSEKPLIILGIDPGTTTAWAALDLEGNLLMVRSGKGLGLREVIKEVVGVGRPALIGTDKAKAPSFVERVAVKTGARLWTPRRDLSALEKRRLVREKTANDHELDAIASARSAFRRCERIIRKVRRATVDAPELFSEVLLGVLRDEESSVHHELSLAVERRLPKSVSPPVKRKRSGVSVQSSASRSRKTPQPVDDPVIHRLKMRVKKLQQQVSLLRDALTVVDDKQLSSSQAALMKRLRSEQRRVKKLLSFLDEKRSFIRLIARTPRPVLLRKVSKLSNKEVRALPLSEGDVLFVEDANSIGDEALSLLTGKVSVLVCRQPVKQKNRLDVFVYVPAEKLSFVEDEEFVLVSRDELEKAVSAVDVLRRVVSQYRRERFTR